MSKALHPPDTDNVYVTLAQTGPEESPLLGKQFPCCVCGAGLEIRFTRKKNSKPYTICLACGIQVFFRGKIAIQRLTEIVNSGLLIAGRGSNTESAVILFNRIQRLRAQKAELEGKQGLIILDPDLENAIRAVDKDIYIPPDILAQLEQSLLQDKGGADAHSKSESERLRNRLAQVRSRIEQAYLDKLDGKITEAFWTAKSSKWNQEEQQILMAVQGLEQQSPERILDGMRILELANKAYFLYLKQPPAEKAKLLRIVLSNCKIDAASVDPTYRKPFDLIFQRVKNEEWLPGLDSN
jgi:hypothetical protein